MQQQTDEVLVSSRSVRARFDNISRVTLDRWVQRGWLPKPVKIGQMSYWRERDVRTLQSQGTARERKAGAQ